MANLLMNQNTTTVSWQTMGAKTAMTLALKSPEMISSIVSVDNAPVSTRVSTDFVSYIRAMEAIEKANVVKHSEADKILAGVEPSLPIRQFLLTNLVRKNRQPDLRFRIPLQTLAASLENLASFPFDTSSSESYSGPALFIRGRKSGYVKDRSLPVVEHFFPNYDLQTIDAGHWVISENPEGFKNVVVDFFKKVSKDI
ncbi:hypothetical protein FQN57_006796 [Myotisia sp. PD_48]|nr:hypothetical protein FQN57_006796 [Myotisia sp. PD_48]